MLVAISVKEIAVEDIAMAYVDHFFELRDTI